MPPANQGSKLLRISELLYLSLIVLAFYLLVLSRTGEANTVWQVLHPAFVPTLFIASFLLLTILFTSEKTTHKLLLIIIYSILVHSFFSIIFPAGDNSGQQMVLGLTRRVFDNTTLHGLSGWPTTTIGVFIVEMFVGTNLQAALSTIFARILSVDIIYVHLSYIPTLWGVLVPIASYLTTKAISGNEKAAVLSSLLVSAFPYTIYFGAISVPNSLGFIFFFYSLYFMLRYLSSSNSGTVYWMAVFSLFTFLSHYLTGIMSFSLLLLTIAFKAYESREKSSSTDARILLTVSFLISVSLLPLSFIYLKYFGTSSNPVFTLDKLYELPLQESVGLFLIGDLTYSFDFKAILLNVIGPLIAFVWMTYRLYCLKENTNAKFRVHIYFLFAAFLIMLIDYGITKVFMEGLPLNVERLWVLRDFIAVPFLALAIYAVISTLQTLVRTKSPQTQSVAGLRRVSKEKVLHILGLLAAVDIIVSALVGGWMTFSLSAGYPQFAPLQTTSYELEAVKSIQANTHERYVVIGDVWTIYAGEMIVGVNNPGAYYFAPFNRTGYDLFANMKGDPSPQWMLLAMNYTNTMVSYFIVTEPRLGAEEFDSVVSRASQNDLQVYATFGNGKLYIFYAEKQ